MVTEASTLDIAGLTAVRDLSADAPIHLAAPNGPCSARSPMARPTAGPTLTGCVRTAEPMADRTGPGFACFVGRPNAGKSTLTNAIVGQKIAITSSRPQTTRHVIRAVLHRPDAQLVLVDTPGPAPAAHAARRAPQRPGPADLERGRRDRPVHPGERGGRPGRPVHQRRRWPSCKPTMVAVVTKTDLVDRATLAEQLLAVSRLADFADIVPVQRGLRRAARRAGRRAVPAPAGRRRSSTRTA